MMQQQSIVLEAEVRHGGQTHKAAYFVEGDVIMPGWAVEFWSHLWPEGMLTRG